MPLFAGAAPGRDPASARSVAHAILSQPAFRPPYVSPIDRLRAWVGRQLAKALDTIFAGHLSALGAILLVAVLAAVVWLIVRAARSVNSDLRGGIVVAPLIRPPADWLAEAAACESRGDWAGALRARYRALVADLARRGVVDEIPGRTSGEYRAEVVRALPSHAAEFGSATDLFERTVYGGRGAGSDQVSLMRDLATRVLAGAR